MKTPAANRRALPAVDRVVQALGVIDLPRTVVVAAVREEIAVLRRSLAGSDTGPDDVRGTVAAERLGETLARVRDRLERLRRARLQPVINGTGVLIHTNLGRAPLGPAVVKALTNAKLNGQGEETPRQGQFPAASEADPGAPLRTYKARPLNGIWAASPYLHNGSVPTLYDLLLPATQRPQTFATGRWSYDPKKVGYVSDSGPFTIDTRLPGNRNTGHEFGADLADGERLALVEYLKTL